MNNYQRGGWYGGRQWDGSRLGNPGEIIIGNNTPAQQTPQAEANSLYNGYAEKENAYLQDLINQSQGQRDLMLKKLDAEHKLALGNDDQATAQFLESVANTMEQKMGRIPYDYHRYTGRELNDFALGNDKITQTKSLALDKLNNDERLARQGIKFDQAGANQNTVEDLNKRGLLTGQAPQGMTGGDLTGLSGISGVLGDKQNSIYAQKYNQLESDSTFGRQDINQSAGFDKRQLDLTHNNNMEDIGVKSRRNAQDTQVATDFSKGTANQNFDIQKKQYIRQNQQNLLTDRVTANNETSRKYNMAVN